MDYVSFQKHTRYAIHLHQMLSLLRSAGRRINRPFFINLISVDDYSPFNYQAADILKFYNLPAIFFIETNGKECIEQIKELSDRGFEIGSHTITHKILRPCDRDTAEYELKQSKKALETVLDKEIDWFCYPRGRYSDQTRELVLEAKYKFARTTKVLATELPKNPMEMHTTVHIYPRAEYKGEHWLSVASRLYGSPYFHLWFHSWELERLNEWDNFKRFCEFINKYGQNILS